MPFRIKVSLAILLALAGLLVFGPLVIPVRPLQGLTDARQLVSDESRFADVAGTELHYHSAGELGGPGPTFVLLHGFGASVYTWHEVLSALGERGGAVAFDRPGFGLSERPEAGTWQRGENPYGAEGQIALTIGLLDRLGIDEAILVGNSAGGTLAAEIALRHPDRVVGLVLVDAAVYRSGGPPSWSRPLLHTPQMSRVGPLLMRTLAGEPGENLVRSAWADPEAVDQETLDAYRQYTRIEGWDRALWEISKATRTPLVVDRLHEVDVRALVITGARDTVVPPEDAERLADRLPRAELAVLPECGHTPQEECPDALLASVFTWLDGVDPAAFR